MPRVSFWRALPALVLLCAALSAPGADKCFSDGLFHAAWTPFQFILVPDVQLFDSKTDVYGLSISCSAEIGRHKSCGFTFAPLSARMGDSYGAVLGVVNVSTLADQKAVFGVFNYSRPYRGQTPIQFGVLNVSEHGWQFGVFNYNRKAWLPFTLVFNYSATPEPLVRAETAEQPKTKEEK